MNKNDVTLNYAFQEYISEKELNKRGIKGISRILTYEEPRWTLKDTASALKIIKEADSALYETIQTYIREQHLPSENTLQLDFGKSLRYDDEYMGDFSKETLSDKLDNRFIVRYSHDNDEGNLIDGGDEIIINDKELVSLFNGMIEGHVKENIQKYDEYKIKREASQKNEVWIWKDYDDLSGHLVAPDGKSYFSYDWTTKEYKVTPDSAWDSFLDADPTRDTSLSAFKDYAQNYIKNNIVKDKSLNIVFERNYIDTEKLMEEEEKKMAKNETLADKYNRIEKQFKGTTCRLGNGEPQDFKKLYDWVQEEFPEKDSEGVLLEATSRMIEENFDFDEFNYQNYDDVYGFGDGAEWRFDLSDYAAKKLLSGEILYYYEAQNHIWEKAKKEFAELKNNPQYKDEIEITDRINSAFRIADYLYPEFTKEIDKEKNLLPDEWPQYSKEEKKNVINNSFEHLDAAFKENRVFLDVYDEDRLIIVDKTIPLKDFETLIKGHDAVNFGKKSLSFVRPNAEQLHDGIKNSWKFDEITTGYAIFQNPDLDVKGGFTPKFISKLADMNVFESDGDAAKQYGIDHNCRILEEKKDIWIGDENLEYYSYPDIPENHRIMEENGWLLKQPLEFDFSEFTEKDFNRIRDELFKDNPKEDYYGRLHIGSIHVEFVINQQDGWVDTNYYILGQKGEGETQFGVPYDHFPGHQIASNLFTDNTYEDFKEMVTKAVLDDIAEETSLKPEAMRPLVDWNDEQQCNELYHTKLVEAARLNEIVIAPYSREKRDIEAVRDFIAGLESVPALEIEDNKVFAVIDNIGKEQTHEPGDFLKIRKNGTVEHISSLGPVEKEPVEVLQIINSFAEDHASVSENGSQQKNDYEYTNSLYKKVYENYIKEPSVDSYKQSLKDIQEQIEKESGIKVDEKVSDEIYSRYKDHDLTLKRNENGSFRVIDDVDGKYTNPLSLQDVVRQVIAWDDKELSELHPGTADDETITKINGYIEKLEHINEKIIERSKEEEKLVNEEKLPLDYDTIKELPDAHEEDIKKYCNIRFGMNIDDKTAIEINDFYWNNDNPLYLHKSPAGNLYVINDLEEEVKQADGEIMVNGSRFRQMDEEKQFEYIKNNFDDENFDEMLEQLGEGRVQVISDALARSFATLDKHEDLWRKLLEKGANPERSIKVVAEDANLGDNLNWLLDNIDKTELKNIFSDNGYADSVFEIAKESVTNDIGSWKTGSDIGFEGFMRIAKLCDREIDAERYYGKVLEKAFEKPVEPAIYGLLDSPERLAAYMNNHRISSNEPTISVEQAADILRYSRYEDYKFYTAKEGNAYILDVSEDYSGVGSRANNFDILTLAHDMAEKALDEEYHDYTEESYKRLDSLYKTYRHHFNPETNLSFTDDIDKMRDFDSLSKDEFLSSYGYLTEEEYDATAKELKEHGRTGLQTVKALAYKNVMDKNYLVYDNRLEKSGSEADKIQSAIERLTDVSLPAVAGEIGKSEQDVAEIISALLDAKDYVEERFNVVRPTADEIIEKVRDEVSWADILKTELSWKELGLNPEDYDRAESGTETEKDFKEWAMGLELENTLDLHGFDTALEGVSSWNNSTISEQKWMIIDKLSEEIVSGKLKIENSQDAFDKLLKENEVYKDFVQKGIVKDDAFRLREISEKEPVDIIKEIATQKELAEVPELFTREFKNRMKTHFPGPEKDPFIVAKAIINDWKTSKPDHIPALNKWLSDSLKEEGFSTKENLEKGFEKFFKKLSSFEQKRMQHKDSDIGQGR